MINQTVFHFCFTDILIFSKISESIIKEQIVTYFDKKSYCMLEENYHHFNTAPAPNKNIIHIVLKFKFTKLTKIVY